MFLCGEPFSFEQGVRANKMRQFLGSLSILLLHRAPDIGWYSRVYTFSRTSHRQSRRCLTDIIS